MDGEFKLPEVAVEKNWYRCRRCGQKLALFSNTSRCQGVFIRCKRCGREEEIRISNKH
ncbi:hypothetical protein AALA13_05185 [Lachnospiraceae bacterium 50-23]